MMLPMFVWYDWKSDRWIWNFQAEGGMRPALVTMGDPALQNSAQVALRQWNHEVNALAA
jgi:hypothetical protein